MNVPQSQTQQQPLDLIKETDTLLTLNNKISNNDLSQQELDHKFKDGERGERYKIHIHRIVVASMYAIGVVMLFLIIIRAWHFVCPDNWKWLNEKQNHEIERIIFSGLILSLASKYFKKYKIFDEKNG